MLARDACPAWLALVVCASFLRCSDPKAAEPATADPTHTSTACSEVQLRANGTCCPVGRFFEFSTDTCAQVGPPECIDVAFTNPEACVPRWCWSGERDSGAACDPVKDADCRMLGRVCTVEELADGAGCDAGMAPDRLHVGGCVPAGYFPGSGVSLDWKGELETLTAVPPVGESVPGRVPPLVSLPAVDDTFFCVDKATGKVRFCAQAERQLCHRGPEGELPDPESCAYVGVPWPSVCPPGFVVDQAAKVAVGQLPPCKPDLADCGTDEYGDADLQDGIGVLFVHAAVGNDSDPGTRSAPLKTIGKALTLAPGAGTVAVAQGVYYESLVVTGAVTLQGRCAAMVSVEGNAGAILATPSVRDSCSPRVVVAEPIKPRRGDHPGHAQRGPKGRC